MSIRRIALTAAEAKLASVADLRMPTHAANLPVDGGLWRAGVECQSFERSHRNPSRERLLT
jgi:hypothetical protein